MTKQEIINLAFETSEVTDMHYITDELLLALNKYGIDNNNAIIDLILSNLIQAQEHSFKEGFISGINTIKELLLK